MDKFKFNPKNRFLPSRTLLLFISVLIICQVQVNGQVNPTKKITNPALNKKIVKQIPKVIKPLQTESPDAVSIIQTSPSMGQKNVPLNAEFIWTANPSSGLTFDVYLAKQRDDVNQHHQFELVSQNQTVTNFHPTLVNGEVYYWKIVAKKSDGSSFDSSEFFFFTPNAAPSAAILGSPQNGAVNVPTNPTFTWQASVDPEMKPIAYSLYLTTEPGQYGAPIISGTNETNFVSANPLRNGETYYWKIKSMDDAFATAESNEIKFTVSPVSWTEPITNGSFTDARDNKTYKTVKIGGQEWMAENLAFLPQVNNTGSSADIPMYKVYDYTGTNVAEAKNTVNYQTYGVLYNWNAAQEVCPAGWHLPSEAEWKELLAYLGMTNDELNANFNSNSNIIADKMREQGSAHWTTTPSTVNNAGKFDAVPAGFANNYGYSYLGTNSTWWTSTWDATQGISTYLIFYAPNNTQGIQHQNVIVYPWNLFSIRCIKD